MDNNELMHYGVPGMKWGVRKKSFVGKRDKIPRNAKVDGPESQKTEWERRNEEFRKDPLAAIRRRSIKGTSLSVYNAAAKKAMSDSYKADRERQKSGEKISRRTRRKNANAARKEAINILNDKNHPLRAKTIEEAKKFRNRELATRLGAMAIGTLASASVSYIKNSKNATIISSTGRVLKRYNAY